MKKMFGINTALIPPFDAKGRVDFDALGKQVDFLISKGVHNLYPLGTMGEAFSMSVEERKLVAEKVME